MKLADVSIRRPVFATVMVGVLVVFGVWAYPKIPLDMMPDVEFPIVTVTAVYPGADPETIESRVIDKLEEAVSTVNGIKTLRSTSMESVGLLFVQFELERKADQAVQDVRDKVSSALKNLPKDLEPPIVERLDINAAPIVSLALAGPLPKRDLTSLAKDNLKQRLQAINGVGGVDIIGGQEREFHVWIDPRRLESYGLAVGDVVQTLAAQNVEIPGGRLDVGASELSVKTRGQVYSARELEDIIITAGGKNISPQNIEILFKSDPYIEHLVVHGDRRNFVSALVTLNRDTLVSWAREHNLPASDFSALTQRPEVLRLIEERIHQKNRELAGYESIKKFAILPVNFSVESGELTASQKLDRRLIEQKYRDILDGSNRVDA